VLLQVQFNEANLEQFHVFSHCDEKAILIYEPSWNDKEPA